MGSEVNAHALSRKQKHEPQPHSVRFEEVQWSADNIDSLGVQLCTGLVEVYNLVKAKTSSSARKEELQGVVLPMETASAFPRVSTQDMRETPGCRRCCESHEVILPATLKTQESRIATMEGQGSPTVLATIAQTQLLLAVVGEISCNIMKSFWMRCRWQG